VRPESLSDYLHIVRRQWFAAGLVFVVLAGTVLAVGLRLPRVYTASILLDVETRQQGATPLLPTIVQSALGGGADPVLMQTLARRLAARALLEDAYGRLAESDPQGARLLPPVVHLAKAVRASVESGSRLIDLSVELREAEGGARNAALLANQLAETLRSQLAQEETEDRLEDATVQLALIEEKRQELEERLDATRRDLLAFARGQGGPTLWSAQLARQFQRVETLASERRAAAVRRGEASAFIGRAGSQLAAEPEVALSARSETEHPLQTNIATEVVAARALAAQQTAEGFAGDSPERRGLAASRTTLEAALAEAPKRAITETYGPNPNRQRLLERKFENEVVLAHLGQEINSLDELLVQANEGIQEQAARIPESSVRLEILQRQAESFTKVYDELLLRQSQVELALAEAVVRQKRPSRRMGGISVIDPARPELRPVRPRVLFLAVAAGVLGLLAGVAAALVLEWRLPPEP
jgi:uncharacterized protein involved in exopolysaccharide biosynthesis